jgi:hypothetical protein
MPSTNSTNTAAIRISAIAVQIPWSGSVYCGGWVWFPQIQVFAGVPVLPKM